MVGIWFDLHVWSVICFCHALFFLFGKPRALSERQNNTKAFGCTVWLAGSLVPNWGSNPRPQQCMSGALTTGLPGNSPSYTLISILQVAVHVLQLDTLAHPPFIAMDEQSHCHGRRSVLTGQAQGIRAGVTLRRKTQNRIVSDFLSPYSVTPQQTQRSAAIFARKILLGSINQVKGWSKSLSCWACPSRRGSLPHAASCPSHSSPAGSSLDAAAWYAGSGRSPGSGVSSSSWCYVKAAWRGMSRCGPGRSSNLCIPWCLEESRAGMNRAGVPSCHWPRRWMWDAKLRPLRGSELDWGRGQRSQDYRVGCCLLTSHPRPTAGFNAKSENGLVVIANKRNTTEISDFIGCGLTSSAS